MYFKVTLFRVFTILMHYASYVTDIIMMINFWQGGEFSYFWITLIAAVVSWIVCYYILLQSLLNWKQVTFLMFTHLDFAFLILHESDSYDCNQGVRKYASIGIQSSISLLITINFLFTAQTAIPLDTYISILTSIFDIALTVVLYNHFENEISRVNMMNWELILLIYRDYMVILLQVFFLSVAFGFVSNLYSPWGAWLFIGGAYLLTLILAPIISSQKLSFDEIVIFVITSSVFCELNDRSGVSTSPFRIQRVLLMGGFYISMIMAHERLNSLLAGSELFIVLYYCAMVAFILWFLYNLVTRFECIERGGARYYLNDPAKDPYYCECFGLFDGN